jgi:hypothetical protein
MAILQWWRTASYQKQHSDCDLDWRNQLVTNLMTCWHFSYTLVIYIGDDVATVTVPAVDDLSI